MAALESYCTQVFQKAGMSGSDASVCAAVLAMTDTWGTFSHGTGAVLNYCRAMRAGGISATAQPALIASGGSWAVLDGNCAMGMLSCRRAMELAIEKAKTSTVSWVGVRNSSHFGAAGYYANLAAEAGMIGIAMSNADPNMTVPGARAQTIGNNPIAFAIPAGRQHPILLDIALSAVAYGKVLGMKTQGKEIPDNWITDAEGTPTRDLSAWPATGSLMPMAGHKGYGIAILVEVLAGVLSGSGILSEVKSWVANPDEKANLGQAFLAIDIAAILPVDAFRDRVDAMIEQLHSAPRAKGADQIYVPGEIEWQKRTAALQHGLDLPSNVIANLRQAGQEWGVDPVILFRDSR